MKPLLSFCVILVLFQTLILGSLVKMEFPDEIQIKWKESVIQKHVVLDDFLLPQNEGLYQNLQQKNVWLAFHLNNVYSIQKTPDFSLISQSNFKSGNQKLNTTIPVFILNGTLRI